MSSSLTDDDTHPGDPLRNEVVVAQLRMHIAHLAGGGGGGDPGANLVGAESGDTIDLRVRRTISRRATSGGLMLSRGVGGSCDNPPEPTTVMRMFWPARNVPIASPKARTRRNDGRGSAAQFTNTGSTS